MVVWGLTLGHTWIIGGITLGNGKLQTLEIRNFCGNLKFRCGLFRTRGVSTVTMRGNHHQLGS